MKKSIFLLILAAGICLLTACSDTDALENSVNTPDAAVVSEENSADAAESKTYYKVELDNGVSFEIGAAAGDIAALYGEPVSVAEAPSCVHEGVDTLYTFSGYTLTTSPDANGNTYIHEVSLTSDAVAFLDGLTIGSEKSAVESAFGSDYTENFGVLSFELDGASVSVVLDEDNCVSGITVTAK